MLNIAQTVGLIIAALFSGYAVATSEYGRRLEVRRRRVERIFDAALALAEAADIARTQGVGHPLDIARRRLRAEIQLVGVKGFGSTELMVRTDSPDNIVKQAEAAFIELGQRLDEVAPRPLIDKLLRRPPEKHDMVGGQRILARPPPPVASRRTATRPPPRTGRRQARGSGWALPR